jgi:hypothetical protein
MQIPLRSADLSAAAPLSGASVDATTPLCRIDPSHPEQTATASELLSCFSPAAFPSRELSFFGPLLLQTDGIAFPPSFDKPSVEIRPNLSFQLDSSMISSEACDGDSSDSAEDTFHNVRLTTEKDSVPTIEQQAHDANVLGSKRKRETAIVDLTGDD